MIAADSFRYSNSQQLLGFDQRLVSAPENFETHSFTEQQRLAADGECLIEVKESV